MAYTPKDARADSDRALKESRKRRDERKAREWEEQTSMNAYRLSDKWLPHLFIALSLPTIAGLYA